VITKMKYIDLDRGFGITHLLLVAQDGMNKI
jgi:hypothetical protein